MSIRACLVAFLLLVEMTGEGLAQANRGRQPGQGPMGQNANNNQADADAAAAVAGGFMCFIGIAVLIGIAIKVFIIIFIVTDAKKRGMDPTLYVILEIFTGLILGLIIYLCSREPLLSERRTRYARDYDGDEHEDDRPRRSRRYRRDRDDEDDDRDRRREMDY